MDICNVTFQLQVYLIIKVLFRVNRLRMNRATPAGTLLCKSLLIVHMLYIIY